MMNRCYKNNIRKIMQISSLLIGLQCCLAVLLFANEGNTQSIDLNFESASIINVFSEIEIKSEVSFVYDEAELYGLPLVSIRVHKMPLNEVLDALKQQVPVQFKQMGEMIGVTVVLHPVPVEEEQAVARSSGTISGRVTDAESGELLLGASVSLADTPRGAATNDRGRFTIRNVEPGTYQLRVTYIGYEEQLIEVTVESGQRVVQDFALSPEFLEGRDVVVVATLRGQARAFSEQRTSDNIKNIVSAEQLARFEDTNLAGALTRVPAVSTVLDRGDAGEIMIRGLNPALATVNVDGQRLASTNRDNRETSTSGINPDMIGSVEVIKAITPDMDADAVSGAINLNTPRPIGDENLLRARIGTGYHSFVGTDQIPYQGSFSYGSRAGKLTYVVNTSYRRDPSQTQDIRFDFGVEDFGNGDQDVLAGFRPSLYTMDRKRFSVSGQFNYEFSNNHSAYFRTMYNNFIDEQQRHDKRFGIDNGDYINPTTSVGGRYESESRIYERERRLMSFNVGANHDFDRFNLNYDLAYSVGGFHEPERDYYRFRSSESFDYQFDMSDRDFSTTEVINNVDVHDPNHMQVRYFERRITETLDHTFSSSFDLEVPYQLAQNPALLKFGSKYSSKIKDGDHQRRRFSYNGNLTQAEFAAYNNDMLIDRYQIGPHVDWSIGRPFFENNRNSFDEDFNRTREQSDPNDYRAQEQILAGYAMSSVDIDRFRFIVGARVEATETSYRGREVFFDNEGNHEETRTSETENDYVNLFPMAHVRYSLSEMTNIRFAYTNTIARPDFEKLAPYAYISYEDEEIQRGNPDIKASKTQSFDLMVEHFLGNVGLISGGVFFKSMKDFTYVEQIVLESGPFAGFRESMPQNGEDANLYGFELAWQQELNFLPGVLSGLGIYANYSYIFSEATVTPSTGPRGELRVPDTGIYERKTQLPLMIPHVVNLALSYQQGGFFAQAAYSYQHRGLYELGGSKSAPALAERGDVFLDRFTASYGQLDFTATQRITPNIRAFLELKNLTNARDSHFFNNPIYPYRHSYHSWRGTIGLSFSM
jgi:TonB-dependent receptor